MYLPFSKKREDTIHRINEKGIYKMIDEQDKMDRKKEQNRKAVKKYREKTVSFAVKYSAVDAKEGKLLKAYLEQTGQSANSYIKGLIKADLDDKGFMTESKDC